MLDTAKAILERGDCVLMFAEGTRIRPGALGRPKRGVGRLALETGAPVVPVAVIGTEAVRKGWRIRPHKVRIRIGSPLTFPRVEHASPQLAAAVTDRIWPNVMLQWEWLGGLPPLRRAAVIGAGARRRARLAPRCSAARRRSRSTAAHGALRAAPRHDLVCFAMPAAALPAAVAEHGARIPSRAGVLVALAPALVPPLGTLPAAYVAERTASWAVGVLGGPPRRRVAGGASLVAAPTPRSAARSPTRSPPRASTPPRRPTSRRRARRLRDGAAALAAAAAGPNAAGSAAGKVFAEVEAYARTAGAAPGTFAGLAGAGDLVATVLGRRARAPARCSPGLLAERAAARPGIEAPALAPGSRTS